MALGIDTSSSSCLADKPELDPLEPILAPNCSPCSHDRPLTFFPGNKIDRLAHIGGVFTFLQINKNMMIACVRFRFLKQILVLTILRFRNWGFDLRFQA